MEEERLKQRLDDVIKLANIGLDYNVDYVYVLQDIVKVAEGTLVRQINVEDYLD